MEQCGETAAREALIQACMHCGAAATEHGPGRDSGTLAAPHRLVPACGHDRTAVADVHPARRGEDIVRIPTWYRRPAWPVARWWVLPLAVLCGLGALGTLWAASLTRDAAPPPTALSPAQAMADGHHAFQRGDFAGAVTSWQQAAHLAAAAQQPQARSVALTHMARAYAALGHADRAEASLRTALPLAEQGGDQAQVALILGHLAELALTARQVTEAEQLVREALGRAQPLADAGLTATLLQTQAAVWMGQQHWPNALAAYRDSARMAQQAAHWGIAARALAHAALAAERAEQPQTAIGLLRGRPGVPTAGAPVP